MSVQIKLDVTKLTSIFGDSNSIDRLCDALEIVSKDTKELSGAFIDEPHLMIARLLMFDLGQLVESISTYVQEQKEFKNYIMGAIEDVEVKE